MATAAPIGATVAAPNIDRTIAFSPNPDDPGYCPFQGAVFVYDEKQDQYVVAQPPLGDGRALSARRIFQSENQRIAP